MGCAIVITTGKKVLVVCPAGARSLLQPEKKKIQSSVWRVRNHYYDRKKSSSCLSGRRVIIITTGKKVLVVGCVSFWFWREMRELALHYIPADCFGIEREIVFGVTYVLSVQYSCAVLSVFLLWWES